MQKGILGLDFRTSETLKWSAVWNGVCGVITLFFQESSIYFTGIFGTLLRNFGWTIGSREIISSAVWGAVIGGVIGFLISKFYPQILELNRRYLNGKLDSFYKLMFWPWFAGSAFTILLGSTFFLGLLPLMILLAGSFATSVLYAKMMTKYVGHLY